jgi:hypothetical protein
LCRIAQPAAGSIELLELGRQARAFASQFLGTPGITPDGGFLELAADLFETFLLAVVLKETPSRRSNAPRDLSGYA